MKKTAILFLFLLISFSLFGNISLLSMKGYVQIKANENAEWVTPEVGQRLEQNFIIYTGFNSSAIIQAENAKIEVKPLSQISISSLLITADKISTDVYLKYGRIKADVNINKEVHTLFKVRSANSTASVRGTVFSFGEDALFVESGTVHLLTHSGFSTLVQKNEQAYASKMNFIVTPFKLLQDNSHVKVLPIGMSDTEIDDVDEIDTGEIRGKARVIIRIRVIQ